jgi:hypothetical protein
MTRLWNWSNSCMRKNPLLTVIPVDCASCCTTVEKFLRPAGRGSAYLCCDA